MPMFTVNSHYIVWDPHFEKSHANLTIHTCMLPCLLYFFAQTLENIYENFANKHPMGMSLGSAWAEQNLLWILYLHPKGRICIPQSCQMLLVAHGLPGESSQDKLTKTTVEPCKWPPLMSGLGGRLWEVVSYRKFHLYSGTTSRKRPPNQNPDWFLCQSSWYQWIFLLTPTFHKP